MGFAKKYITHPDVKNINKIHAHINEVHSLFLDAGFIQSEDIGQYDLNGTLDIDYSQFLESTSYGTFVDIGRFVFDFPDYYDDDGCELKLKIGVIFSIIKTTAYNTAYLSEVAISLHHRYFITPITNGESSPMPPFTTYNAGYYMYSTTNSTAYRSTDYSNSSLPSILSYDKNSKTLYLNICPSYKFGNYTYNATASLGFIIGTMARDKYDRFYNGADCSFMFTIPYFSTASTISSHLLVWNSLSQTGVKTCDILNTPLHLGAYALVNGTAYYQNFYTQTKDSSYVSPSKNIILVHNVFSGSHNIISKVTYDGEDIGSFITVDLLNYTRGYMNSDSGNSYRFLVRISSNE